MLPLSFSEYLDFLGKSKSDDIENLFKQYIEYGSFPTIIEILDNPETIGMFLEGIYNTVLVKDVIERNNVRDTSLLESLLKFIAANIGSIVSSKKISDYLTSSGRKTSSETIDNYLRMLEKAFIIYKANRFDLKGKLFLKTFEKYYISDIGIRNQITGLKNTDYGHILENIVYLELIRRGFNVAIGKTDSLEIDFVVTNSKETIYYQVSASIENEETRHRELRPLKAIQDNYPKIVLTMDKSNIYQDFNGIKVKNIIDFLLEQ
jgi:predicted AAA+ superfamily ATPase